MIYNDNNNYNNNNDNNNNIIITLLKYSKEIVIYKLKVENRAIKTYLQFLSIKKSDNFFLKKKGKKQISSSYNSILVRNKNII